MSATVIHRRQDRMGHGWRAPRWHYHYQGGHGGVAGHVTGMTIDEAVGLRIVYGAPLRQNCFQMYPSILVSAKVNLHMPQIAPHPTSIMICGLPAT